MYITICFDENFPDFLETIRMLTGEKLSLRALCRFLKVGVILAFFPDGMENTLNYSVIKKVTDIISKDISVLL